jgi:hypothetical protein
VVFWSWDLFEIMLLFWAETVIIGLLHIPKLILAAGAQKTEGGAAGGAAKAIFFALHYGIFCTVHGVFVVVLFGSGLEMSGDTMMLTAPYAAALGGNFLWCLAGFFLSHLFSFFYNFIGDGEMYRVPLDKLFMQPYGRVIVMHLTVLFGGFITLSLGAPLLALMLLCILKAGFDLKGHLKERKKAQPVIAATA